MFSFVWFCGEFPKKLLGTRDLVGREAVSDCCKSVAIFFCRINFSFPHFSFFFVVEYFPGLCLVMSK